MKKLLFLLTTIILFTSCETTDKPITASTNIPVEVVNKMNELNKIDQPAYQVTLETNDYIFILQLNENNDYDLFKRINKRTISFEVGFFTVIAILLIGFLIGKTDS
jgi:hypothetical protein